MRIISLLTNFYLITESKACLMGVDFMPNDQWLVTSSLAGEFSVFSVKRQERIFHHDSIPELEATRAANALPPEAKYDIPVPASHVYEPVNGGEVSNIMYCVRSVKGVEDEENVFLVGAEDANVTKYKINYNYV